MNPAAWEIARVAAWLFAMQGYEATSVRMIVQAAGVTKTTCGSTTPIPGNPGYGRIRA
jgi:hypothetical protein